MVLKYGMGWLRDFPDRRDYNPTMDNLPLQSMLNKIAVGKKDLKLVNSSDLPNAVDLRVWCSPVRNQETIGSCTAQTTTSLLEYFENRAFGTSIDASRLFVYKASRNLMQTKGDSGSYLRITMGALALFGAPPEKYYLYDITKFDDEPSAFIYSLAQNYQALKYYRLDPPNTPTEELLLRIKTYLTAKCALMFGFTCYESLWGVSGNGGIPYPSPQEKVVGAHALLCCGFNNDIQITNPKDNSMTTGAFLIKNSWSDQWGNQGFGWLPFRFITDGLAVDWWSLLRNEWVDTGRFGL